MRDLTLLVIDDDELVLQSVRMSLPPSWRMQGVGEPEVPRGTFHAALIDIHLTGRLDRAEGVGLIRELHSREPHLEIVAMSGDLNRELMEECLKAGATRFLAKPLSPDELRLTLGKIEEWWLLQGALQRASSKTTPWIGNSPVAREVQRSIAELKGESGPILIEGESGTGKEIVAGLLHAQNSTGPFIAVNVAGIPEHLFESEFFGHVRGAFTGAEHNKMGLAEAAHGGDLFLDEIEALPASQQAKLLRFLESGEVRRVGAKDAIHVSCRLICATNRSLNQLVNEGKFREDLLWRLSGKKILLPPLRQRLEDIKDLCAHFFSLDTVRRKELDPDAQLALMEYTWPGNVRELRRVCEQLLMKAPLPVVRRQDVLALIQPQAPLSGQASLDLTLGLPELVNRFEAEAITQCLERHNDIDEAARVLKISRSSLYKKIKDHNIQWRGQ